MLKILFVCVENANRSQMAQAFARLHGGAGVEAFSAGSRPSGVVNAKAVAAKYPDRIIFQKGTFGVWAA